MDEKSKQKRCEKLEDLVSRERLNRFAHKCDEYPNFVPLKEDRIKIDTQMLISANSNKPHAQTYKKKDLV
jgi:hypothetical protein